MDAQEIRQCLDRIEDCVDEAKRAAQAGSVPQALRDSIEALHQQAKLAKQGAASQSDENALRQVVVQLEQTADRTMQASANAGNTVDLQTQQALQRAHGEASKLKKQMQAGSPA
jgi:DNA-binding ferritin-like protein